MREVDDPPFAGVGRGVKLSVLEECGGGAEASGEPLPAVVAEDAGVTGADRSRCLEIQNLSTTK